MKITGLIVGFLRSGLQNLWLQLSQPCIWYLEPCPIHLVTADALDFPAADNDNDKISADKYTMVVKPDSDEISGRQMVADQTVFLPDNNDDEILAGEYTMVADETVLAHADTNNDSLEKSDATDIDPVQIH